MFDKATHLAIVSIRTELSSLFSSASLESSSPSESLSSPSMVTMALSKVAHITPGHLLTEGKIIMSAKLFVGNLSPDTTSDELRALFSEVGGVDSCQLIMGPDTGRSKGFGFIEMNSVESADAAKEKLNGQVLNGRTLKVDAAKAKTDYRKSAGYTGSRR